MRTLRSDAANLVGARVNGLTVETYIGPINKDTNWLCRCDCGRSVAMKGRRLREGRVNSCGCRPQPKLVKGTLTFSPANKIHGEARYSKNHSREYDIWCGIKSRTGNPNVKCAKNYIGRGITMCQEWRESYPAFLAHVGRSPSPRHSIGRINNDLGYQPGNVRWETVEEQANNTRWNRFVTVGKTRMTVAQWSRALGVKAGTLYSRVEKGKEITDLVERHRPDLFVHPLDAEIEW